MSFSGIARPREDTVNKLAETSVGVRQIGSYDVAGNVLHPCDRLEPSTPSGPRGLAKETAAFRR